MACEKAIFYTSDDRLILTSPTALPEASSYLWNPQMLLQVNCQGFVKSQFMQSDATKYSHGPNIEAKTFMMPEQEYYAHHPGRFFYLKDEASHNIFSVPFAPVKQKPQRFEFSVGQSDICWRVRQLDLEVAVKVQLAKEDVVEIWQLSVRNLSPRQRRISVYPYFSIGYMSWMNQSADFDEKLNGVIAKSITPYQKTEDYFKQASFKDQTFLLSDRIPDAFCARLSAFEGRSGLHFPEAIKSPLLENQAANFETPTAVMQYRLNLAVNEQTKIALLFGPAKDGEEAARYKQKYLAPVHAEADGKARVNEQGMHYNMEPSSPITIESPDRDFNHFINCWLPRQVYYHGDTNRVTSDPQTRNYLQDYLGFSFLKPQMTRLALIKAVSQQNRNGALPDGILLNAQTELKYINQIPHTDHCVWLPLCLQVYLDETNDYAILRETIPFADSGERFSMQAHIERAMTWLIESRDRRGLSYIEQGDWCDPMNMVGYKGKGVSSWLTVATAYSLQVWASILEHIGESGKANQYLQTAAQLNQALNKYCWDGQWYARGITDDNNLFGISSDVEGKIYLNPQSWALLSGAADGPQTDSMLKAIKQHLETPDGVMMLAPAYTSMRADIGRLTQKFPGVAENGSIYNHASTFYAYALYQIGQPDQAFEVLRKMIPDATNAHRRRQLPVFIPNYYRGAYFQMQDSAGRSSQLFNTGTVAWYFRCVVEKLCGLKGDRGKLLIQPQLPSHWKRLKVERDFQGARFSLNIERVKMLKKIAVTVDGKLLDDPWVANIQADRHYQIAVKLPLVDESS